MRFPVTVPLKANQDMLTHGANVIKIFYASVAMVC